MHTQEAQTGSKTCNNKMLCFRTVCKLHNTEKESLGFWLGLRQACTLKSRVVVAHTRHEHSRAKGSAGYIINPLLHPHKRDKARALLRAKIAFKVVCIGLMSSAATKSTS